MKIEDFSDEEILQEFLNRYLKNDLDDDFFVDEVFDRGLEYKFQPEYTDDELLSEIEEREIIIPFRLTESFNGRNVQQIVESIYQNDYNSISEKDLRDLIYIVLGKIIWNII